MHSFISGGVDGIIPDAFGFPLSVDPSYITQLAAVVSQHPEVRLATREDNPFHPALQSYGVQVSTADDFGAGTDANLSFTLHGCRGSATIVVDSGHITLLSSSGRMEAGNADWTTIPSADLGKLSSITIVNDGQSDGLIDDSPWTLRDIAVASAHFLGPDVAGGREYRAHVDGVLAGGQSVSLALAPSFAEPLPTIACPAPIVVPNTPGSCGAAVAFSPAVDGMCADVTAVSSPASGSTFPVATTTVTSFADSPSTGQSASCSFPVTVLDTEPPVIACPAPIVVDATGPQGAAVSFTPSASDNCSIAAVTTSPTSGGVFSIGTTTVTAATSDPAGNAAACSFTVHVAGAAEQLTDLSAAVEALAINHAIQNALRAKLNAALAALAGSHPAAVCGALGAFVNLVEAQAGKQISAADANALLEAAARIRDVIGC